MALSATVRDTLAQRLRSLVGSGSVDLSRAPDDPGLFGPGSPAWRVHADFSAMMIGGISALLLQMLHPMALAGVWDHSNFRKDRLARLRGTARFIAATTFGSIEAADASIARVRAIHDKVHGTLPDGTRYDANDPALLTWVHVAEVDSFLRAYLRYRDPGMTPADQDLYLDQNALVAERLGATNVPRSRAAIVDYYAAVRPDLRFDHRTREVADALLERGDDAAMDAGMRVAVAAAEDLLPPWAATMHGRTRSALARPAIRAGAGTLSGVVRWALARR